MRAVLSSLLPLFLCLLQSAPNASGAYPDATYMDTSIEGWRLHINTQLLKEHEQATQKASTLLQAQLKHLNQIIPPLALKHLHQVDLYFHPPHQDGLAVGAAYHPGAQWLIDHHRDPKMAKAIEFHNILIFEEECRRMPFFVLHELAHAFHDRVLGFHHPEIRAAFEAAKSSGKYDVVQNWTGTRFIQRKAYALTNEKEYFAETSEAFFGKNDFQPFDRKELQVMDPTMFKLLETLWNHPAPAPQSATSLAP